MDGVFIGGTCLIGATAARNSRFMPHSFFEECFFFTTILCIANSIEAVINKMENTDKIEPTIIIQVEAPNPISSYS